MNNIVKKISILEAQTVQNIKLSKATNTIRAYKSDLRNFENFCQHYKLEVLPADVKTVSLYITNLSKMCKFSTIKRRLSSIKVFHKLNGSHIDLKNPIINDNLNGIKRQIGTFQKSKNPILISDLKKIVLEIDKDNISASLKLRNKALVLVGFSGAFRRSELVSILREDLDFVSEGVKIFVKKSKTDQSGEGMIKAIPYFSNSSYCPVMSLKKWLTCINNDNESKVFKMSDKNVSLIIKKYISRLGYNSFKYSGHSLRSGFATTTAEFGAEERQIMAITGHKSNQMVRRYIKEVNLFKNNALKKIQI